ncbi:MAG TPA: arginine deiminase family protein, partial [bacterium]|nr:arginine deiminase family protein [bacterium]
MFANAIVRTPGKSMIMGLTTAHLGVPDYERALLQHQSYIKALIECGLNVTVMPADEEFPDSTFVEDTALVTPHCAIITNPGAASRKGETAQTREAVSRFYSDIEEISEPGTVEAGDVLMVGGHYYVGLSGRTNRAGADQLIQILESYGMTGSTIELEHVLHLKTGVAYLEHNNLVVSGEFVDKPEFARFNKMVVPDQEAYAANSI